MKASVLGCPSRLLVASFPMMNIMETDGCERCRQPVSLPSSHVVDVERQPTHGYVIYLFFFHISCPLLYNCVNFKLTDLWSLCQITFLGPEKRENHLLIPCLEMHLMPKTRVVLPLALFLTKASLRLPHAFPSYIYSAPSSFSFISSWQIFKRETKRDCRFLLRRLSFRHFIYRQSSGLSS